jgi:hypothetical protein
MKSTRNKTQRMKMLKVKTSRRDKRRFFITCYVFRICLGSEDCRLTSLEEIGFLNNRLAGAVDVMLESNIASWRKRRWRFWCHVGN